MSHTTILKDKLNVSIFKTRAAMGAAAAEHVSQQIRSLLLRRAKEYVNIIFASAPSQNEFLDELKEKDIDWDRINAFHMDEYVGMDPASPQGFGYFLRERLFDKVPVRKAHYLNGKVADIEDECKRYAGLLVEYPVDIVCLGIGENTHLAFNDPHVANFRDPEIVKVIELDHQCRLQQVNDGCFPSLGEVPKRALTITIPALVSANHAVAIAPGKRKADAIYHTLISQIGEKYPSTVLRRHPDATLYIDIESATRVV